MVNHITSNHHFLNEDLNKVLRKFIVAQADSPIDEEWFNRLIAFMDVFPDPILFVERLDNFWNLLSFHAKNNNNNEFLTGYIKQLRAYQAEHHNISIGDKIALFQSEISSNK